MFGIIIQGTVSINKAVLVLALNKPPNEKVGSFSLVGQNVNIGDLYTAITKKEPKAEDDDAIDITTFTKISFKDLEVTGTRDAKGKSEILVTGAVLKAGFDKVDVVVCIQQEGKDTKGNIKPAAVGLSVNFAKIPLSQVLNNIASSLKLETMPIFTIRDVDVNLVHANNDIKSMSNKDIAKKLEEKKVKGSPLFKTGTNLIFKIPMKKFFETLKIPIPKSVKEEGTLELTITIVEGKISFLWPDTTDIVVVMLAVMPKFAVDKFDEVMTNHPNIRVDKFDIDSKKKSLILQMCNVKPFSIGNDHIKDIDKTKFVLEKKDAEASWEFSAEGQKQINQVDKTDLKSLMKIKIKKKKEDYSFEGK